VHVLQVNEMQVNLFVFLSFCLGDDYNMIIIWQHMRFRGRHG